MSRNFLQCFSLYCYQKNINKLSIINRSIKQFSSTNLQNYDDDVEDFFHKSRKEILKRKKQSTKTFDQLAKQLNVNKVWLTSALLGRHPINEDLSRKLMKIFNIEEKENQKQFIKGLSSIPENRGLNSNSNKNDFDPTIRRFNELFDVYGDTFKTLIREELGDGIMSAIDCTINFEKKIINEKNESRIVITIDGKFLPYKNEN